MSFQYVLWAVGLTQVYRYRVRTRERIRVDDPDTIRAYEAIVSALTRLDHDANVRPWVLAARDAGAVVLDDDGVLPWVAGMRRPPRVPTGSD